MGTGEVTVAEERATDEIGAAAGDETAGVVGDSRRGRRMLVAFYVVMAAVLVGLAIAGPFDRGVTVTRLDTGPAWPLTVPRGTLRCEAGREITFQRDGTTYSLNRTAPHGAYSDVTSIRADAPGGGKMDLAPLVERGIRLCH